MKWASLPFAILGPAIRAVADPIRKATGSNNSTSSPSDITCGPLKSPRWRRLITTLYGGLPPPLDPSRETAWLDGLRGVAALLVMTYHYHLEWWGFYLEAPYGALDDQYLQIWRLPFLRLIMCAGHVQVSIFFVLSGFVLSWSPLASIRAGNGDKLSRTLASATFRRWLRLYLPCFVVGLWSMFEYRWGIYYAPQIEKADTFLGQLWDYIKACERFADPFAIDRAESDYVHIYNWTMWTIPHEFAGSLLVFLLVLSVARIRNYYRRAAALGVVMCYAIFRAKWTYWLFSYGVMLADHVREAGGFEELSRKSTILKRSVWITLLILGLFLAGVPEGSQFYTRPGYNFIIDLTPENWKDIETGGRFWWCIAGIVVVTSACHLRTVRRFFEMSFMRYLGRISYMLYLTHRLCFECLGKPLKRQLQTMFMEKKYSEEFQAEYYAASSFTSFVALIVLWMIMAPLAFLVAHWCEVLIDRPSVQLAKWVDTKFVEGFVPEKTPRSQEEEMVGLMTDTTDGQSRDRAPSHIM